MSTDRRLHFNRPTLTNQHLPVRIIPLLGRTVIAQSHGLRGVGTGGGFTELNRFDLGLAVLLLLLVPVDALAYLDPGSGSMLLQLVLAGLFSALFFLKSSFRRIRSSLARLFRRSPPDGNPPG